MKKHNKLFIGFALTLAMLSVVVSLAYAQPQPIGTSTQPNPWDSNPGNVVFTETSSGSAVPTAMYDGRLTTLDYFTPAENDFPGDVEFNTFDAPASPFPTIGWVDIKMKYSVDPYFIDDTYRIEYTVGTSASWVVLQPDTSDQFDPNAYTAQVRSWAEQPEPNDGTWTWTDVGDLRVRIAFDPGSDGYGDWNTIYVYEVWATVYEPPLPLGGGGGGAGMSIQPPAVATLAAGRRLFVDIYVQSVTGLAGYQFTINYNTTVLTALAGGWSYYPFTDMAVDVIDDVVGYVSMSYTIPLADPHYTAGVSGNFVLARIYFKVDAGMTASDYSWITFSVSLLGMPGSPPPRIGHWEWHGRYGTPPPDTYLFSWFPVSSFPYASPITTYWIEEYPNPGIEWHLSSWTFDNGDDILSVSDQIDMTNLVDMKVSDFHVDEIWDSFVDYPDPADHATHMVCTKKPPAEPEFPLGIGILTLIVPVVPIVYIWRLRKKNR